MISQPQNSKVQVTVYANNHPVFATDFVNRIELGRQQYSEPDPYIQIGERVVVAGSSESEISRRHLLVEAVDDTRIKIVNQSAVNGILIGDGSTVGPKSSRVLQLPTVVSIGNRVLEFDVGTQSKSELGILDSLPTSPAAPGEKRNSNSSLNDLLRTEVPKKTEFLLNGLHLINGIFQQSCNAEDFFEQATHGMIDVVGMENAAVLLWKKERWHTECILSRSPQTGTDENWSPSQTVLRNVLKNKRTFWRVPKIDDPTAPSLIDVKGLIAAPFLNSAGEVVGVLYGDRVRDRNGKFDFEIDQIDAVLVETIASGIAAGLERIKHEQDANRTRVLFEQFFTPELARELESTPDLLMGKDEDVSLLICEIQGFSEFSEKLGARLTLDWINDAMGTLSDCIAEFDGTLVDMMGDELIGMWGAPKQCSDHAIKACQAAVKMFHQLPHLNRRWQSALSKPMDLAIGVHTGVARVGNIGSSRKFKYGPLGKSVRVAIQTQRTTKQLAAKIIITGETRQFLTEEFATRQLNDLVDKQSGDAHEMFELVANPPADWQVMKRRYEAAVGAYQDHDYPTAIGLLAKILSDHPGDRPSLQLMSLVNQSQKPKPWTV